MKKLQLTSLILLFTLLNFVGKAQITLEHTYSDISANVCFLETEGYKYYSMDVPNKQCRLYNQDHSLWKTINISTPTSNYLYDIKYISQHLFNSDDLIELLVVLYEYIPTSATDGYYIYTTRVINENDNDLVNIPGGGYNSILKVDANYKLLSYVYDFSEIIYLVTTKVYSIPGSPVSVPVLENPMISDPAFPNPTSDVINIPFQLPAQTKDCILFISDMNGRVILKQKLDTEQNPLKLNTSAFSKGSYLYYLKSASFQTKPEKIIVQ